MSKISWHVLSLGTVFCLGHRATSETNLVQVDDSVAIIPSLGQEPLHRDQLLPFLLRVRMLRLLEPLDRSLLYRMQGVDLPEQGAIQMSLREPTRELLASFDNAQASLLPQGPRIYKPFYLVVLQESQTISLSWAPLHPAPQLLQERQLLLCIAPEPLHVQLPDLGGRDAEDLAESGVRCVLHVVGRGHHPPELQFDDVVDLLVGEVLHHFEFDYF